MQNEFQYSVPLVFLWKTWLDATHGTEKSAFRWKYYEMHDMVQSKSFNGDSKVLHYMVEWKDSMHTGFYVQLPWFAQKSLLFEFESNTGEEKTVLKILSREMNSSFIK